MKIETKFNVGDIVYYLVDKQNIKKGKIEKSVITIRDEKGKDTICIEYLLDGCSYRFNQYEIFKDFEDFKNSFWLKFEGENK
jgi:hypothetical protein